VTPLFGLLRQFAAELKVLPMHGLLPIKYIFGEASHGNHFFSETFCAS
jgi:hypothetical protein